jgi:MoaA/NifB/PqqE/SkfB family radical SAM enzyme
MLPPPPPGRTDLVIDDRVHIKRLSYKNVDTVLCELRGKPFEEYRVKFENARQNHVRTELPLQISFDTVSYCNLLCKMCYRNYKTSKTHDNMPMAIVDSIVKQAKEMKTPSIWLGVLTEPLLHPEIITILRKIAHAEPLDYWITTNATCLNENIAKTLIDIPITKLSVSLDAATSKTYKIIRGGNYEKVIKNIDFFLEMRARQNSQLPFLRVTFVEQQYNRHEKEQFYKKWKDVADIVDIQVFRDCSIVADDAQTLKRDKLITYDCIDPFYHVVIDYDGRLLPCCIGPVLYNVGQPQYIHNLSLKDYWQSQDLLRLVETIESHNYFDCCYKCVTSIEQ